MGGASGTRRMGRDRRPARLGLWDSETGKRLRDLLAVRALLETEGLALIARAAEGREKAAARNAAAVDRMLAAGATIIGKTICEELFFSVTGINVHYGMPANVRAPGRMPGGSTSPSRTSWRRSS